MVEHTLEASETLGDSEGPICTVILSMLTQYPQDSSEVVFALGFINVRFTRYLHVISTSFFVILLS